jgi:hypothetical protein
MIDEGGELLQQNPADSGIALCQGIQPAHQHGQRFLGTQVIAETAAVKADEVQRQFGHQFRRH